MWGRVMGQSQWRARSELGMLVPFGKALYREQAIALFRLVAALTFFIEFPLLRGLAGNHEATARLTLLCYVVFSLVVAARVFIARPVSSPFLFFVHASDILWPSLICLFTGCSRSPFTLLFIFALLVVPYRRKSVETFLVALTSVCIVALESVVATLPRFSRFHLLHGSIQLGPFAVRAAILLILGGFLATVAHWSEREQQAYAVRSILRRLHANAGIKANLREILPAMGEIFEARRVVLVMRNSSTWRTFELGASGDGGRQPVYRDVPSAEEDQYFWPMPEGSWSIAISNHRARPEVLVLDREGDRTPVRRDRFAENLHWRHPFTTLLATTLQLGTEWTGRVFLIDPPCTAGRESCLRLLQQLANEVGPAVYDFYLWHHTSARVRAVERQRLARDLHDGVVQSLIATEMQIDLLRRRGEQRDEDENVTQTLHCAQEILRTEVRRLREQIEQLRSSPPIRQPRPAFAELLTKFQRETGIAARFACDVHEDSIPERVAGDVKRIVEEALSNVRKHSGASKVDVHLASQGETWEVVIQDDGRGFDFTGRFSLAQLDAARKGPRVIRERVRSANGELILESWPNRGSRLRIRLASS